MSARYHSDHHYGEPVLHPFELIQQRAREIAEIAQNTVVHPRLRTLRMAVCGDISVRPYRVQDGYRDSAGFKTVEFPVGEDRIPIVDLPSLERELCRIFHVTHPSAHITVDFERAYADDLIRFNLNRLFTLEQQQQQLRHIDQFEIARLLNQRSLTPEAAADHAVAATDTTPEDAPPQSTKSWDEWLADANALLKKSTARRA